MIKKILTLLFLIFFLNTVSYGAGSSAGSGDDDSKIKLGSTDERAYKLVKIASKHEKRGKLKKAEKNYKKALGLLLEANKEKPSDPDILNYLGFTSRKLGNFDNAEIYYLMGLEINPNHNGINEYLGELYLQTNRKDLALERLEILKVCNCEEYEQLKDLVNGTKTSKY